MPIYVFDCPNCGHYETIRSVSQFRMFDIHECTERGMTGTCVANLQIIPPAIERLESVGRETHTPSGERIEQGFYNHTLDGPRGDGYFSDRASYKTWLKANHLKEK